MIVHDHLGFGFSDKPADYSYSLIEQAEVALGVWRALGVTRGHLVAHDYGTSVATELLARRERGLCPVDFASVTLANGSVHIELAHLTPSQRVLRHPRLGPLFARLAIQPRVRARSSGASSAIRRASPTRSSTRCGRASATAAAATASPRSRATWTSGCASARAGSARSRALDLPAHVLWGRRDPVAVPAIAEQLAREIPGATLTWLDDLGHYPMLEAPARWADAALGFIDALPPETG